MTAALHQVLRHPGIWRGREVSGVALPSVPTGFPRLDAELPGGGWPRGALTEIAFEREGIGELSLPAPALAALSRGEQWIVLVDPPHLPYAPALSRAGVDLSRLVLVRAADPSPPPLHPHPLPSPDKGEGRLDPPLPHPGGEVGREGRKRGTRAAPPVRESDALWAAETALRSGACAAVLAWPGTVSERGLRKLQLAAEAGRNWGVYFLPASAAPTTSPAALRLRLAPRGDDLQVHIVKRRGGPAAPFVLPLQRFR